MNISKSFLLAAVLMVTVGCSSVARYPEELEVDLNLANTAFEFGKLDSARTKYQHILQRHPNHAQARLMLARVDLLQDRAHAATQVLEALIAERADNAAEAALILGRSALDNHQPQQAEQWFEVGLTFDSDQAALHNGLGVALDATGTSGHARHHFERAVALEPDSKSFRTNLALNYLFAGEPLRAQRILKPMLDDTSVPVFVQRNYVLVLLALGEDNKARKLLANSMPGQEVAHDLSLLKQQLNTQRTAL